MTLFHAEFLKTYDTIGDHIAEDRKSTKSGTPETFSPVVPESHYVAYRHASSDSTIYGITVLKGQTTGGRYESETFIPGTVNVITLKRIFLSFHIR